jgi:hypothetical protein
MHRTSDSNSKASFKCAEFIWLFDRGLDGRLYHWNAWISPMFIARSRHYIRQFTEATALLRQAEIGPLWAKLSRHNLTQLARDRK